MRPRRWLLGAVLCAGLVALAVPAPHAPGPFGDRALPNIAGALGAAYGEPTALTTEDGRALDLWFSGPGAAGGRLWHGRSTDGAHFAHFGATTVPAGYKRPHVLRAAGRYYLYAAGRDDTTLHLFVGADGLHFRDQGQVLAPGPASAWDGAHVANTFVWHAGHRWLMLYEANGAGPAQPWSIGLASSPTAAGPWTRDRANPVVRDGGNPELARVDSVPLRLGGSYVLYFHTISGAGTALYRASSTDLRHWSTRQLAAGVRYSMRPLWNGHAGWSYGDQALAQFRGRAYLFYSPSNQVDTARIDVSIDRRPLRVLLGAPAS